MGFITKAGLKYEHETLEKGILLKDSFSGLKNGQGGFGTDFHSMDL